MGKTADLAMIQKMNIDTLHKEGKSQKVRYRVLYQSILNAKLTGRKNLGRKRCTSNRDDRKLENTVKQSWFKHLGVLHKEWTEAGVSASRVTTLRRLQEKGYQATSEPETTSEARFTVLSLSRARSAHARTHTHTHTLYSLFLFTMLSYLTYFIGNEQRHNKVLKVL